jgi:hypothetical protein
MIDKALYRKNKDFATQTPGRVKCFWYTGVTKLVTLKKTSDDKSSERKLLQNIMTLLIVME